MENSVVIELLELAFKINEKGEYYVSVDYSGCSKCVTVYLLNKDGKVIWLEYFYLQDDNNIFIKVKSNLKNILNTVVA